MFIDPFHENWFEVLAERVAALPEDVHVYLLLDGAFVPGFYRKRPFADTSAGPVHLLFGGLPGATDEVKDASPFLTMIAHGGEDLPERLKARLAPCEGFPMVSAIATTGTLEELGERLAAWCVVENDGQRFNFRFPDTRRLPGIYATLTPVQQAQMCGPMLFWSYIGRDGAWSDLAVTPQASEVVGEPKLDDVQFGRIVDDCLPDEILFRLAYSGFTTTQRHSVVHATVSNALIVAREAELSETMTESWCEYVLDHPEARHDRASLDHWLTLFADEV